MNERHYPLRLPLEDAQQVDTLCAQTRVSFNRVVTLCVHQALPSVRQSLTAQTGRVTNVDPLPDKTAHKLYAARQEDEDSIRSFIAAQPKDAE